MRLRARLDTGRAEVTSYRNTTHPSSPELRAVEAQGHVTEHDALLSGSAPDYGTVEDDLPELRQTLLEQKQSHDEVVATKPLKSRIRTYAYWAYYIPIARWLPVYSVPLFAGDCAAGLTMACLLVPQAMAYAGLAKLDPVHGLFAVCIPGFIYAILGSSAQLSVGPEAALSLLTGQTISSIMKDVPDHHAHSGGLALALATMITLQVGMITFLLGEQSNRMDLTGAEIDTKESSDSVSLMLYFRDLFFVASLPASAS